MSDEFEGIPINNAADVPAYVNTYGSDYGQEILDNTGEQNQSLAGDAAFNDATRAGQTTNNPNTVSDYNDYGSQTGAGAPGTSTTVTRSAGSVNPASDPSQFPAYDDNGNLQPGFEINPENGLPYYAGAVSPTTSAAPVNTQDGQAFNNVFPDPNGSGGFVDAAGNPVNADGSPIAPIPTTGPVGVDPVTLEGYGVAETGANGQFFGANPDAEAEAASAAQVGRQLAQQQAVNAAQKKTVNNGDWRVRLSLAPGARYLYNAPDPGILDPLTATDGIIFPYTPKIDMAYKADYDQYALTHSNYKGYFYKSSYASEVQMHATFTAQDSTEADYLLAVIHFFRSVTKMFYGQDPQRGAPPPLVYLSGLGQYQFAAHPCAVTSFSYSLPDNIDYIRARSVNINGTNLLTRRVKQDLPTNPISGAVARLANLFSGQGISYGAEICRPPPPTLGQNQPTYVPTKMEIQLSLLPMQTRQQVSQQFSLRGYANGDLLKRGFW
jgi:hypothetical protein